MNLIALNLLRLDGGTQPRGLIDFTVVQEYAAEMRDGVRFPPVVAFYDGAIHWLADGFHRANAADSAGLKEIECDVRQGTREDAVWYSCSANRGHGLRRTNADKRRAVETALKLRPESSDRAIAEHVGVHPDTVGIVRREIAPRQVSESDTSKRSGRDGKQQATHSAKRSEAGKASAAARAEKKASPPRPPEPEPEDEPEDEEPETPPPAPPAPRGEPVPAPCALPSPCACRLCVGLARADLARGIRWWLRLPAAARPAALVAALAPDARAALREALDASDGTVGDGEERA